MEAPWLDTRKFLKKFPLKKDKIIKNGSKMYKCTYPLWDSSDTYFKFTISQTNKNNRFAKPRAKQDQHKTKQNKTITQQSKQNKTIKQQNKQKKIKKKVQPKIESQSTINFSQLYSELNWPIWTYGHHIRYYRSKYLI